MPQDFSRSKEIVPSGLKTIFFIDPEKLDIKMGYISFSTAVKLLKIYVFKLSEKYI